MYLLKNILIRADTHTVKQVDPHSTSVKMKWYYILLQVLLITGLSHQMSSKTATNLDDQEADVDGIRRPTRAVGTGVAIGTAMLALQNEFGDQTLQEVQEFQNSVIYYLSLRQNALHVGILSPVRWITGNRVLSFVELKNVDQGTKAALREQNTWLDGKMTLAVIRQVLESRDKTIAELEPKHGYSYDSYQGYASFPGMYYGGFVLHLA